MELTKEQSSMLESMTKLKRNCAIERAKDSNACNREIYIRGGGTAKSLTAQETCAGEILNNPEVVDFLNTFNVARISPAIMTRDKLLEDLTVIASASVDDVMVFGQTGHEYIDTETGETLPGQSIIHVKNMSEIKPEHRKLIKAVKQTKYGIEVTLHDAMAARKQIADMQGFNAPTKTIDLTEAAKSLDDDSFADSLASLGVTLTP